MKAPFMAVLILPLFLVPLTAHAQKDWGIDPWLSSAYINHDGPAWLCVVPDGSGPALTEAQFDYGVQVNATITVELFGYNGNPVVHFPAEDLWVESLDGGLQLCAAGTVADDETDANGTTHWTQPFRAGGHSEANCQVFVNGMPFGGPGLELHFTSPDINGDLEVGLADLAQFAHDYFTGYAPRSDFWHDGVLNLSDFSRFAQSYRAFCP